MIRALGDIGGSMTRALTPFLLVALFSLFTPKCFAQMEFYDKAGIERWLNGSAPRGDGDLKNSLPRGNKIKYCAGAGCPIKIPFTFSARHIEDVKNLMHHARMGSDCLDDTAACERLGLQHAMRAMDKIVKREKLDRMSHEQVVKNSVMRDSMGSDFNFANQIHPKQQFLRDCVDQSANGMSFLIVLANNGLVSHHSVIAPGLIHIPLPHFFTRIKDSSGRIYRFDLYQTPRNGFDKLPGIKAL